MTIGEQIKSRRIKLNLSVEELAQKLGKNRATVYRYESDDIVNMPISILEPLAKVLETTPAELCGWHKTKELKVPVLRNYQAGMNPENIVGYMDIPQELPQENSYFALKIKTNAMAPRINSGDIVLVQRQETAESGDVCIIKINGDDVIIKQVIIRADGILLQAFNQSVYANHFYSNEEIKSLPIKIIGKCIELRRNYI